MAAPVFSGEMSAFDLVVCVWVLALLAGLLILNRKIERLEADRGQD